jgi:sRNA-binding protein
MDQKTEKESSLSTGTLKLRKNRALENTTTQEVSNVSNFADKKDTIAPPLAPTKDVQPKTTPSFTSIYKRLHKKFPEIINIDKPVLLAVGIRKEMSQETGVSSTILRKWIGWYCYKSNYYALHKQGAVRFNLDGSEAGTVSENHQENIDKKLEKKNAKKLLQQAEKLGKQESVTENSVEIE